MVFLLTLATASNHPAGTAIGRDYVAGCYGTGYCYWGAERSVIATLGYDF
ncbi:hypothetical protein [Enterobacter sp. R1(2018)]|nr:hypothetical protein [Enterobacter sp. R1(2018)]